MSRASYDHDKRQENELKAVKIGNPFSIASFDERSEYIRKATQKRSEHDSQDRLPNYAHKKLIKTYPERDSYLKSRSASDWDTRSDYASSRSYGRARSSYNNRDSL